MKRNKLFILGICTVMVALVSLSLVSGTWARYTSTVSGSDTATVAKWNWTYNGGSLATTGEGEKLTFGLFETIVDTVDGATDEDVDAGLIAPGTKGQFKLSFTNASEVNAEYTVTFSSSEEVAPIEYSLDGSHWVDTIAELSTTPGSPVQVDMGQSAEITVYWQWAFEPAAGGTWTNADDTALGLTPVTHKVTATVVFDQVD